MLYRRFRPQKHTENCGISALKHDNSGTAENEEEEFKCSDLNESKETLKTVDTSFDTKEVTNFNVTQYICDNQGFPSSSSASASSIEVTKVILGDGLSVKGHSRTSSSSFKTPSRSSSKPDNVLSGTSLEEDVKPTATNNNDTLQVDPQVDFVCAGCGNIHNFCHQMACSGSN